MMKKNFISVLLVLMISVLFTACAGQKSTQPAPDDGASTVYVAPFWKICEGDTSTLCLQVRESTSADWMEMISPIVGFDFEPGFSYQLSVKPDSDGNQTQVVSSSHLTLVSEQSKTAVEMPKIDLTGTQWTLVSNTGVAVLPATEVTMDFAEAGRLGGNAGCNSYGGDYALQGISFTPGMMMSTLMACEDSINLQESSYLAALQSMKYLQMENDQLLLVSADGQFLQFKSR
jgi:heat shock protein HslJ